MMAVTTDGPLTTARQKHTEVRLSGFGGQGIMLAGAILGRAAVVHEGRYAVMVQSYGPESRGGACLAELILSDREVEYPRVVAPQVVVVLSQEAYEKYGVTRPKETLLIAEEDLVRLDEEAEQGKRLLRVPATRLAEELGRRIVANMVMLGFLCRATSLLAEESLREAIAASVPKGTEELNLRAFDAGYTRAEQLLAAEEGRR